MSSGTIFSNIRKFLGEWMLVLAILIANEFILRHIVGITGFYTSPAEWTPYILIGAAFVLISNRAILVVKIVLLAALQLIWFSTYRYFGNALSPDLVLLSLSQLFEIGLTAQGEFHIFALPLAAVFALNTIFFVILNKFKPGSKRDFTKLGVMIAILPFVAVAARAMLHASPFVMVPTAYTPSHTSTIQAAMLAVRSLIATQRVADLDAPNIRIDISGQPPEEPTRVVFVMGESIAPSQMEVYGGAHGTMPLMHHRMTTPSQLSYFPKLGFSAGVATLGSVPMTLRLSHNPVLAQRNIMTLPQIAKKQGFSVGLYSAQNLLPLQIAGGLNAIDALETIEQWKDLYKVKSDGILIDQMKKTPLKGDHQFYFLHQRTNHSPYSCDLDQTVSEDRIIDQSKDRRGILATFTDTDRERVKNYRHGLLCYDRNLDEIISHFQTEPGAVYIFITADHNEFLGEGGRWGHARLELDNALVPMILVTNRPDSDVAKAFRALDLPTSFQMTELAAKALGAHVGLEKPDDRFYVNGVLAFGQTGYIAAQKTDDPATFRVTIVEPSNAKSRKTEQTVTIPELSDMLDFLHNQNGNAPAN